MENKLDIQIERYIINRFISMPKLFDSLGIDYRVNANMYCPFHDNYKTPAAHLYADETGYRLWCFSENRMYGAWNVYKEYMPKLDTNVLATTIFNRLSEEDRKRIINDLGAEQELDVLPYQSALTDFKRHKINITELLHNIAESYQNDA